MSLRSCPERSRPYWSRRTTRRPWSRHHHFRYGLFEISTGMHPDDVGWVTHRSNPTRVLGTLDQVTQAIRRSQQLLVIAAEANLSRIAAGCRYPDWLGYLGLMLYYTGDRERGSGVITRSWCPQLLRMIDRDWTGAASMLRDLMAQDERRLMWSDLGTLENALPR